MQQDLAQTDEETWEAIRHESMDELAQEIGRMCLYWSELEMEVTLALDALMNINDRVPRNILLGAMDFRTKLQVLLPVAFNCKINDHWYSELETVINIINGELRNERNRIIHDSWFEFPARDNSHKTHRVRLYGKVVNKQSRTKELQLADYRPFGPKDVGLLYVRMIRARGRLSRLMHEWKANQISD